ncbi:MAG: exodeoxyribonuclease VII small subunit, partial [Clostridium sp.]|nr:exodeoxyribonuclease VII small subunit [Clostridium sp.]
KGDLTLEESIQAFEKGIELSKTCNDILDKAEKRINILVGNGEALTEENFIPEE